MNYRAIASLVVEAIRSKGDDIAGAHGGITVRRNGARSNPTFRGERALKADIERVYRDRGIHTKMSDISQVVSVFRRDPDLWRGSVP